MSALDDNLLIKVIQEIQKRIRICTKYNISAILCQNAQQIIESIIKKGIIMNDKPHSCYIESDSYKKQCNNAIIIATEEERPVSYLSFQPFESDGKKILYIMYSCTEVNNRRQKLSIILRLVLILYAIRSNQDIIVSLAANESSRDLLVNKFDFTYFPPRDNSYEGLPKELQDLSMGIRREFNVVLLKKQFQQSLTKGVKSACSNPKLFNKQLVNATVKKLLFQHLQRVAAKKEAAAGGRKRKTKRRKRKRRRKRRHRTRRRHRNHKP